MKDVSKFKNAKSELEMSVFLQSIKNVKNNKAYKKSAYKDQYIKEKLVITKPHLSLLLKILNNDKIIYINETSKDGLRVWDY